MFGAKMSVAVLNNHRCFPVKRTHYRGPPEQGGGVPGQYDRLIEGSRLTRSRS